jgi:hypothetical protein
VLEPIFFHCCKERKSVENVRKRRKRRKRGKKGIPDKTLQNIKTG